jgi:SAM-dependent methyltransferase
MTTIPPEQQDPRPATHEYRQVAEGFGSDAERYDRARPGYPDALIQRITAASPGREVLDVGCGTGIAARLFQAAGCDVLGVDPDARMAGLARQRGLPVEVAKFEDWDSGGRQFDTVIAAQAWHWVDPVAGAAQAARALRPGGRLAVFWNAFQAPPEVAEAFAEVYRRVPTGLPLDPSAARRPAIEAYRTMCGTAADGMRRAGGFGDPELWQADWERPYTRDEWLEFVPTAGGMSQVPPDRLAELLAGIGATIDAAGGSFVMQYSTVAETAVRA